MKRPLIFLALGAALALGASSLHSLRASDLLRTASRQATAGPSRGMVRAGEVLVQFRGGLDDRSERRALESAGAGRAERSAFGRRYRAFVEPGLTDEQVLARFDSMGEVEFAERNGVVRANLHPNDRLFQYQWHMRLIGAERIWDIQTGDPSVVVAVLDSGIAFEDYGPFRKAPDWGSTTFVRGYNVFTKDEHANDDNFHGTHVSSTIAEATNNGDGVAGLAYHCALMPVKVLDEEGFGSFFDVAEGIDYATNFTQNGIRPVKVINLSLGGDVSSQTAQRAIDRAVAAGITVVASAGNDNGPVGFPAALPNVIAVGAVDGRKVRAFYSNFGPELDLMAPGGDVDRDDDHDGRPDGVLQQTFDPDTAFFQKRYDDFAYFFVDGTSQAAPHVSAVAALLYRQGITDPAAVRAALEQTADDLGTSGRDDQYGYGLINAAKALSGLGFGR
jgi:serine protease